MVLCLRLLFPEFDGDNPKLWISRCEDYFELYNLDPSVWIKFSSMHFIKDAGRSLQSVEKHVKHLPWSEFYYMILDRFGRDEHESLIRQLFHIKQLDSVSDYITRFTALVD